jgi:hypothetical protein
MGKRPPDVGLQGQAKPPFAVIKKNILAIQTPGDDMMNRTGDIESSVSRHAAMITTRLNVN